MNTGNSGVLGVCFVALIGVAGCGPSSDTKKTEGGAMSKMDMKDAAPAPKPDARPMDQMSRGDTKGMDAMKMDAKGDPHKASASVKKVDAAAQVVTLDHAPVASLNWPAMTMSLKVKDKSMLEKLAVGNKVEVEFVQQGSDYVITDVK